MAGIIKPEPLRLGDRFFYTLTSYDPVTIEIRVPRVIEDDVDLALEGLIAERCQGRDAADVPTPATLTDEWVAAEYPEIGTVDNLRLALRRQLEQMNAQASEESKGPRCAAELAKRLGQSVPEGEVARVRAQIQQSMAADLAREGMSVNDFMRSAGLPEMSLNAMLDEQAQAAAEQDAALDAFAQERKLKVEDAELPQFLGAPSLDEAQRVIEDARSRGQLEYLRQVATRMKAMRILVAECSCGYVQETLEEAEQRTAEVRKLMANRPATLGANVVAGGKTDDTPTEDSGSKADFKLV